MKLGLLLGFVLGFFSVQRIQWKSEQAPKLAEDVRILKHRADSPIHGIRWMTDLRLAMRTAKLEGKPVFVMFAARQMGQFDSPFY